MTDTLIHPYEVVCPDTSELTKSEWLALRKTGIGSSDAAGALGLSPWTSQYTLWAEKSGLLREEEATRDRFIVGLEFEPVILKLWAEREGVPLESIQRHVMCRSIEYPYMLANPDGLTDEAVIEVKTCSEFDKKRWDAGVPDQYVIQGLHLMKVTGRRKCVYPVMFGFDYPVSIEVTWDEATAQAMAFVEGEMWRRVLEHEAPDLDGSENTMMTLREQFYEIDYDSVIQLPQSAGGLLAEREVALETAKIHTLAADEIKAQFMLMLGDKEAGELDGQIVVTWKKNKTGRRTMRFAEKKVA